MLCLLNKEDVTQAIRDPKVSAIVSEIAANKKIRIFLRDQQKAFGKNKGVVMDGRDIGTVIFPQAELKIFLTADLDVRVDRRYIELQQKGIQISQR